MAKVNPVINHASITGAAANPNVLVDGPKWDAAHTVEGLGNLDDTADADKPVSTATQTALIAITADRPRVALLANTTFYVRTNGSDSNTGLANTAGGAFLSLQKAADTVQKNVYTNGFTATIDITGAYTTGAVFSGANSDNGSVVVTSTAGATITKTSGHCIVAKNGCQISIGGSITFSTVTTGICLLSHSGGKITTLSGLTFGAAGTGHMQAGFGASPSDAAAGPGTISITGNYTIITGGGVWHWHAPNEGSNITAISGVAVTLTGTPAFSSYFAGVTGGTIFIIGVTFSGSATGPRYLAHNRGLIYGAASTTSLPGSVAGTTASGGVFAVSDTDNEISAARVSIGTALPADSPLTINTNTAATVAPGITSPVHIVGTDSFNNAITMDAYGGTNFLVGRKANGTQGSKTGVVATDTLHSFDGYGWDTGAYGAGGAVRVRATQTWSGTAHGSEVAIRAVPNDSIASADALLINAGGVAGAVLGTGSIKSNSASDGIGYATGAGGAVTQATSKTTGVTLNKISGQITMNAAAFPGATSLAFTLTNSAIAATDVVVVNVKGGFATAASYQAMVEANAAGSCSIVVRNITGGSLSEAVVLNFAVIKAVNA